jgi:hypothetical protein
LQQNEVLQYLRRLSYATSYKRSEDEQAKQEGNCVTRVYPEHPFYDVLLERARFFDALGDQVAAYEEEAIDPDGTKRNGSEYPKQHIA